MAVFKGQFFNLEKLNNLYGKLKPYTSMRGYEYGFLGMTLKYRKNGTLEVRMESHIDDFIESCTEIDDNPGVVATPATKSLTLIVAVRT